MVYSKALFQCDIRASEENHKNIKQNNQLLDQEPNRPPTLSFLLIFLIEGITERASDTC